MPTREFYSSTPSKRVGAMRCKKVCFAAHQAPFSSNSEEPSMKSLVCGVSLALVLLGIGLSAAKHEAQAAGEKKFPPATEKAFDDAVAKELKAFGGAQPAPGSVPGAVVGVWVPGRGAYVRAVGYSNLSPQQPMALDDKFRVGSNTKTFVITVLLQLVDEHKLSLDDPDRKFDIGVKIPNGEHITVRELCQ